MNRYHPRALILIFFLAVAEYSNIVPATADTEFVAAAETVTELVPVATSSIQHDRSSNATDVNKSFLRSRRQLAAGASGTAAARRGKSKCIIPEIVLAIDRSLSYDEDFVQLLSVLPTLFAMFKDEYANKVRFSIVTFTDKPKYPFGHSKDYCAKVDFPLTLLTEANAIDTIRSTITGLQASGGDDYFEAPSEVLFRAAASDQPGWSKTDVDPVTKYHYVRILAVVTDAPTHQPGDVRGLFPHDLNAHKPGLNADINHRCAETDYPSGSDVLGALTAKKIIPIILTGNNYYLEREGDKVICKKFLDLITAQKKEATWGDLNNGLKNYYTDYMTNTVGATNAIVQNMPRDPEDVSFTLKDTSKARKDFTKIFEDALNDASANLVCPETTTKAAPPQPRPQRQEGPKPLANLDNLVYNENPRPQNANSRSGTAAGNAGGAARTNVLQQLSGQAISESDEPETRSQPDDTAADKEADLGLGGGLDTEDNDEDEGEVITDEDEVVEVATEKPTTKPLTTLSTTLTSTTTTTPEKPVEILPKADEPASDGSDKGVQDDLHADDDSVADDDSRGDEETRKDEVKQDVTVQQPAQNPPPVVTQPTKPPVTTTPSTSTSSKVPTKIAPLLPKKTQEPFKTDEKEESMPNAGIFGGVGGGAGLLAIIAALICVRKCKRSGSMGGDGESGEDFNDDVDNIDNIQNRDQYEVYDADAFT